MIYITQALIHQPTSIAELRCNQLIAIEKSSKALAQIGQTIPHASITCNIEKRLITEIKQQLLAEAKQYQCYTILKQAKHDRDKTILKRLLKIEAIIDVETTALHEAVKNNEQASITFLIEAGVEPNRKDKLNKLAYEYAVENNHTAIMKILSQYLGVPEVMHCLKKDIQSCTIL